MVTGRALYSMGAAFWNDLSPAYFSDVRGTYIGVDLYNLIIWEPFSETGTELDIMEPCHEEPWMSNTIFDNYKANIYWNNFFYKIIVHHPHLLMYII